MAKAIKYLIIHCTATPEGREITEDDIRLWHLSPPPRGKGWKQVGYTDLFHLNGDSTRLVDNNENGWVESGEITNGVTGINNVSRHIVYAGGTDRYLNPKDTRTNDQQIAMRDYVMDFVARFPEVKVAGHNQFSAKACPSFDVPKWLREIGVPETNIYKSKRHELG
jgi:hypothetical protein